MAIKAALEQLQAMNLPEGKYVVIGSAIMEICGLREAADLDVLVTDEVFAQHQDKYPEVKPGRLQISEDFELCRLDPMIYDGFEGRLEKAEIHDGIPFMGLADLLFWKEKRARPKDLVDAKMIREYLEKNKTD